MRDLIYREQALNTIRDEMVKAMATILAGNKVIRAGKINPLFRVNKSIQQAIRELPSAEKTGKWIFTKYFMWECSECGENPTKGMGYVQSRSELFRYCPNCGARMK